jgi:ribosomal protein S18 acetylase RimI-like enzyme
MSLTIRSMREGEEDKAAQLICKMPKDIGLDFDPLLTAESLRANADVAKVTVAEEAGNMLGVCLWTLAFSSWRGAKGIYVSDLYILPEARSRKIGEAILREVVKQADALGAKYVKMEVDENNLGAQRFYERLGFVNKPEDRFYVLEPSEFAKMAEGKIA